MSLRSRVVLRREGVGGCERDGRRVLQEPCERVDVGLRGFADGSEREPSIDYGEAVPPQAGDTFLLCSDGLWAYFSDAELGGVLSAHPPRAAAEILIQRARDRAQGRGDNCSLVIVKLVERKVEKKPAPGAVPPGSHPPKA